MRRPVPANRRLLPLLLALIAVCSGTLASAARMKHARVQQQEAQQQQRGSGISDKWQAVRIDPSLSLPSLSALSDASDYLTARFDLEDDLQAEQDWINMIEEQVKINEAQKPGGKKEERKKTQRRRQQREREVVAGNSDEFLRYSFLVFAIIRHLSS
jgi:hypothetical protein